MPPHVSDMDRISGFFFLSFSLELFHLDQVSLSTCEYTHHVIIHVLLPPFKPKGLNGRA